MLSFFTSANFTSNYVFTDMVVKTSFLDYLTNVLMNPKFKSFTLFSAFVADVYFALETSSPFTSMLYFSEYQDLTLAIVQQSPELVLAFRDFHIDF
jgi:hypothetical protein